ncbi:MAG: MFS transporter, partial [Myxococcales bacterium]|nr:MFS transporter [Myxococcales bacterium]
FSFYGMKAILYVYLTALFLRFLPEGTLADATVEGAKAHATETVHLFIAGVYLFPLVGAVLADRLLGKYNVIFWVSLIYCAGHAVLAVAGRLGELGQFEGAEVGMFVGLGLIAMGSGGIKPCVSANVGDQFTSKNGHLVTRVFQIFYFIINFGSFFSTLLTPILYSELGPEVAFGVPGVLMAIATFVFWLGRKRFVRVPAKPGGKLGLLDALTTLLLLSPAFALTVRTLVPSVWLLVGVTAACMAGGVALFILRQRIEPDDGFLAVLVYSIRNSGKRGLRDSFWAPARERFGAEAAEGPPAVLRIMLVFLMVSMFWALFDQHSSTWVEQARHMALDLTLPSTLAIAIGASVMALAVFGGVWLFMFVANKRVPMIVTRSVLAAVATALAVAGVLDLLRGETTTIHLKASQMAALNPLMVMMIIPGLNALVWNPLRRRGKEVAPLRKMTIGLFLAAVAFAIAAALQGVVEAEGEGEVHALWQFLQYFVMTTSEVLVSVTGLEFAYTQAPRRMKSTIMGFWLFCVTLGNLLVAYLAPLQKELELSEFFWLFAGLMAGAAVIFTVLANFYRGRTYLQSEA